MNSKGKIAVAFSLAITTIVLSAVAIVAVLAAPKQQFSSSINVSYTSMEVVGEASARWKVGNEDWQNMTDGGEPDAADKITFSLEANQNASLSPTEKNIQLSSTNPFVVLEYTFINSGSRPYAIDLFYTDDETTDTNISVYCVNSDEEITEDFEDNINTAYGNWSTTTIEGGATKYVYVLASIISIGNDASYSGEFQFNLDGKIYSSDLEFDGSGTITGVKNNSLSVLRIPSEIDGVSVTKIAAGAIADQTSLIEITIPDSVTEIEQGALNKSCTSLKYILVPFVGKSTTATNSNVAFFGYIFGASSYSSQNSSLPTTLTNVILTGGTKIGIGAFYECSRLISVFIPEGVTSIGDSAFEGCSGLTGNLIIPSHVTSIGNYVFRYCSEFNGNLTIPQGVTSIGSGAFQNCSGFTGDLTIPQGVTSIGSSAFYNCSGLTSVTVPESVTSIGSSAFSNCKLLTEVTIESEYAYTNATSTSACGYLLNYATTVRVLTSLMPSDVENYAETGHAYINKTKFPTIETEEDGKYTVYKK